MQHIFLTNECDAKWDRMPAVLEDSPAGTKNWIKKDA